MIMHNKKTNAVNETLRFPLADSFEADLTAALEAEEDSMPSVIAMLDLDCFLHVNETFGHAEGDRVLIETGRYLKESLPQGSRLYRYGGDAFSVLFPADTQKEDAFLAMEALRAAFAVKAMDGSRITLSIGIAAAPEDASRYGELVRKADGAMARAKHAGRNRVCLAREEKMVTKTAHYTQEQLQRLAKLAKREGLGEAVLLREALDAFLKKHDV